MYNMRRGGEEKKHFRGLLFVTRPAVQVEKKYNVPSNDRDSPILRLPARTFHEEFTGTTFIIFGPTVMT